MYPLTSCIVEVIKGGLNYLSEGGMKKGCDIPGEME